MLHYQLDLNSLVYSDGTNVNLGIRQKGYYTPTTAYTAVDGDQLLIDTSGGGIGLQLQ